MIVRIAGPARRRGLPAVARRLVRARARRVLGEIGRGMKRQAAEVAKRIAQADIVITTALIPGRRAPVLVSEEVVQSMKPGSVILDMAVEQGGNCAVSEAGSTVTRHNVHVIGIPNLPATVPADSSALYARNVIDFLKLVFDKDGRFAVNLEDDIIAACLMYSGGEIRRQGA